MFIYPKRVFEISKTKYISLSLIDSEIVVDRFSHTIKLIGAFVNGRLISHFAFLSFLYKACYKLFLLTGSETMKTRRRRYKKEDRLSDLPDCLLLHILSFLNTKCAFQTCVLSWRWKNLWKRLSILRLTSTDMYVNSYSKLLSRILSLRSDSTSLHTLEFTCDEELVEPHTLKSIVNYAVSHNVQRLLISFTCDIQQFSPCLFSCQTLTSLHLSVCRFSQTLFPKSLH